MTEILTESFCERCGTRYTFEPVETRRPLASIGTFGRGLRHFFTDPGSTLGESFAVARSESEQRATTHALEAFHQTFNFCLTCRQYVCGECWNAVEGRCLTCAPVEEPAAVFELAAPAPAASLAVADIDLPRIEVVGNRVDAADRRRVQWVQPNRVPIRHEHPAGDAAALALHRPHGPGA